MPRGQWYTEAVAWAAENGVVNGVGGGKFEPDGNVTREQIATILYRYAGLRGVPTGGRADLGSFRTAEPSAAGPMTPCRGPTRRD